MTSGPGLSDICCPECRGEFTAQPDRLTCTQCGNEYPQDFRSPVLRLIGPVSGGVAKKEIQSWWGDLFQQLYDDHAEAFKGQALEEGVAELEDLFHKRHHLAAVEMPLSELKGRRVLEIGPGAGGHSTLFATHSQLISRWRGRLRPDVNSPRSRRIHLIELTKQMPRTYRFKMTGSMSSIPTACCTTRKIQIGA